MIFTMVIFFPNMEKIKNFFSRIRILCYEIETEDFYEDISNDVEKVLTRAIFQKIIQVEFLLEKIKKFPD